MQRLLVRASSIAACAAGVLPWTANAVVAVAPSPAFLSLNVWDHGGANATSWQSPGTVLDYNKETHLSGMPVSVEFFFATLFVLLMASVPAILVVLIGGGKLTKAHKIESACLIVWLCTALFLFTNVLKFNSSHFTGSRPLTLVEAVYLLSQILTTVGYGDITPALPRGQVWVAVNVILALCLYGSLVMEVVDLLGQRLERAFALRSQEDEDSEEEARQQANLRPLVQWDAELPPVDKMPLYKSCAAFTFFACVGVLFWHYFPGEGKTWLQAVYMSIITLSTVGFGWFNATTEGGKVFGAFWMLFGVASLAGVIGSFVDLMMHVKAAERRDEHEEKLKFFRYVKMCTRPIDSLGDNGMDTYDFLKFGVLLKGIATEEEVKVIEERFAELVGSDGRVRCDKLAEVEGPPAGLLNTPRNTPCNTPRA
mmetsp:Transcript_16183/g.46843  ORF Transcript_16183/g.46843 Transcript_16183/m.46843 type:complete len:425 (-) Transcript_16183:107-1381(-)